MAKDKGKKLPRTDLEESIKGLDEVGRTDFFTPKEGKNTIRILPWKRIFYFKASLHYGFKRVGGAGREMAYPCLFTVDEDAKSCPICDYHEELGKSTSDKKIKLAGRIRLVTKYYVNVIDRDRPSEGIRMYGFSGKMMRTLRGYLEDEDYGDITDPEEGKDVIITREGTGFTTTSYDLRVRAKSTPIDYPGWEEELHELDKEVLQQQVDRDFLKKKVNELKEMISGNKEEEEEEEKPKRSKKDEDDGDKRRKPKKSKDEEEDEDEEEDD